MDPDFLLIRKMKMGDERSIEDFVRKYYPGILKYCRMHIRDHGDAEDMTQETFARFFQSFHQYQSRGKIANYLYVIAANGCKDYYRKKRETVMENLPEQEDRSVEEREDWLSIGKNVVGAVPILFVLYGVLTVGLPAVIYHVYRNS